MKIKFAKMQALGNDYIYVCRIKQKLAKANRPHLAKKMCAMHFVVGADGLILVAPGKTTKFRMIFYNPDGTEAEICGNGIRCFARFLYEHGLSKRKRQRIETKAGIIHTEIISPGDDFLIQADMGKPILERKKIPVKGRDRFCINETLNLDGRKVKITSISLGNPHTVIYVKEFGPKWRKIGEMMENHHTFPRRTNVEFQTILIRQKIRR